MIDAKHFSLVPSHSVVHVLYFSTLFTKAEKSFFHHRRKKPFAPQQKKGFSPQQSLSPPHSKVKALVKEPSDIVMFINDTQTKSSRSDHVLKRSSDPVKVGKNPFFDSNSNSRSGNSDVRPAVPVRKFSNFSDAAKDILEYSSSSLDELTQLDDFDSQSYASSVSDITNPTVFLSTKRSDTTYFSGADSVKREHPLPRDLPPRPAAREVTRELTTYSEIAAVEQEDRNAVSPPPPPPPPRRFTGEVFTSSEEQQFIAERLVLRDNDTPLRPFARRLTAASVALAVEQANVKFEPRDNDAPPRPFSRRLTAVAQANLLLQDDPLDEAAPPEAPCVPSALIKLAQEFILGVRVATHSYHLHKFENTFVGQEAVDFMLKANPACSREDAVFLGQRFLKELSLFHHVTWDHNFKDGKYFYRFTDNSKKDVSKHPYISCLSLLKVAEAFERDVRVSNHVHHFMKYKNSFVGSEAVDYLVLSKLATDRKHAVFLGQRLFEDFNLFDHVSRSQQFKDAPNLFYRFSRKRDSDSAISYDSSDISMSSLLSVLQKRQIRHNGVQQRNKSIAAHRIPSSARSMPSRPSLRISNETTAASKLGGMAVTFGSVEERMFERTLELHPSTSSGPSIGLGWSYEDKPSIPLAEVSPKNGNRRKRDLVLSSKARKSILSDWGHTKIEMFLAARVNEKIREQRKKTLNSLSAQSLEAES